MQLSKEYSDIIKTLAALHNIPIKKARAVIEFHFKTLAEKIANSDINDPETFKELKICGLLSLVPLERKALKLIHKTNRKNKKELSEYKHEIDTLIAKNKEKSVELVKEIEKRKYIYKSKDNMFNRHANRIRKFKANRDEDIHNGE